MELSQLRSSEVNTATVYYCCNQGNQKESDCNQNKNMFDVKDYGKSDLRIVMTLNDFCANISNVQAFCFVLYSPSPI